MKKITTTLFILLVAITSSYSQASKSDVIGTWKIDDVIFNRNPFEKIAEQLPEEQKALVEGMLKSQIDGLKSNSEFTYETDGTYHGKTAAQPESGTWELTADGTKIIHTQKDGSKNEVAVKALEGDRISFIVKEEIRGESLVMTFVCSKK